MATTIKKKDYRSDIVLTMHMTLNGETVTVPQHDFILRFFTENDARHYDCGRIKGELLHCSPSESDPTELTCYIKNHGLGCGMLQCTYIDMLPNDGMENGVQRTFSVSGLNVELVDDASDDTQVVPGSVTVDPTPTAGSDNPVSSGGVYTALQDKQDTLVSGTNIKSINGQSVLGLGNIELGELYVVRMTQNNSVYTADKSVSEIYAASYTNGKPVIAIMSDTNTPILILSDCNPDGNSYVFSAIESNTVTTLRWQRTDDYTYELETIVLQPHLVSGTNIKTVNNESLLGSGNVTIASGEDGKSAYQSYLDTTSDNPPKTEAEWVASLKGDNGVGFASASSPITADGTWQIKLTNGDTITIDLNHEHPQYLKFELVQSLPASPDSGTLYLIAAE